MKHLIQKLKSGLMLLMAVILSLPLSSLPALATEPASSVQNSGAETLADGTVLKKTAQPVDGMVNQWDVTLQVEAPESKETSDIVLVIDTSNSMNRNNRMNSAKNAAKSFINTLLPSEVTRVGIVNFDYYAHETHAISGNKTTLENAVNGLSAKGGTFTQAAVKQAEAMLAASSADNKHIVLLSDGEPTYSYKLSSPDTYLIPYGNHRETSANAPVSAYLYGNNNRAGNGSELRYQYGGTHSNRKYYNNGNSAIAEAGFAKNAGYRIWSIALEVSATGQGILQNMASPNSYYTATPANLNTIFQAIAGQMKWTVQDAVVEDMMAPGIKFVGVVDPNTSSIITNGDVVPYTNGTGFKWNVGDVKPPKYERVYDSESKEYKYVAKLTYRVEPTQAIVNETPDTNGFYPANANAIISYKNENSQDQTGTFPVPKVDPVLVKITKNLEDDGSCANCEFTFTSNRGDEFKVKADETKIFIPVVAVGAYILTETEVNGSATALNQFTVTPDKFEGVLTQTCDDLEATFTNTLLKPRSVKVEKKWVGKKADSVTVNLLADKVKVNEVVLNESNSWKHTFHNLRQYDVNGKEIQYTISENPLDEDERYEDPVYTGSMDDTLFVTNTYIPKPISITGYKKWVNGENFDGGKRPDIQLQLKQNGKNHGSPVTLTGGETPQTSHTWDNLDETDINGKKHVYTVDEVAVPDSYEKTFENNNLTVVNTYKSQNTTVTVTKKWKGGSVLKPASIKVNIYRQIEGGVIELALGNEEITDELGDNWTKTWQLPATDDQGNEYTYSVEEIKIANFTPSYEGLEITNTYNSEVRKVTANKEWVNGPSEHPPIWFQLYRQIKGGTPEIVPNANIRKVTGKTTTWSNIAKTDDEGRLYEFSVKEVDKDGNDFTPTNYTKVENGLTVTNTYVQPQTDENVVGAKIWKNGPEVKPTVSFELWRKNGTAGEGEKVVDVTVLTGTTVDFGKQLKTDINGVEYEYYVVEPTVPVNYKKIEDGLTVTNTYESPKADVTATKVWIGGSVLTKPDVTFQLKQNGVNYGVPVILETADGNSEISHTWKDLDINDKDGVAYEYTVEEVDPLAPWSKVLEIKLTVTNKYTSPKINIPVEKLWEGGEKVRPESIEVNLLRDGVNAGEDTLVLSEDNSWSSKWTVDETDAEGNKYVYTVEEIAVDNFTSEVFESEEGVFILNTYNIPTKDIMVKKVWEDPFATHPDAIINLLRDGEVIASQVLQNGKWFHTWKVEMTDIDGTPYTYTIEEEKLENYESRITGSLTEGFVVTNCWLEPGKGDLVVPKTGAGSAMSPFIALFALFLIALGARGRKLAKQIA